MFADIYLRKPERSGFLAFMGNIAYEKLWKSYGFVNVHVLDSAVMSWVCHVLSNILQWSARQKFEGMANPISIIFHTAKRKICKRGLLHTCDYSNNSNLACYFTKIA